MKQTLGRYAQAETLYLEAVEMPSVMEDPKWKAHLYKKIGDVRKQMARINEDETGAQFAYHQAAEILGSIPKPKEKDERDRIQKALEGLDRAQAQLEIYQARYSEAETFLELAKKRAAERTESMEKNAKYGLIPDVSLAANLQLEAEIERDYYSRFKDAERLFESARKTYKSYYRRSDHPRVMACKWTDFRKFDHFETLRALRLKYLDINLRLFGEEHPATAVSYSSVGTTLRELCRHQEALEMEQKALAIRLQIFGDQHPVTGVSYRNVGTTLRELGRYQEALVMDKKALAINQRVFGEEHFGTSISYNNVGCNLGTFGCHQEALEMQQKALVIRQQIFGDQHSATADTYNSLGFTLEALGRHQEALEMQQQALTIRQKVFGNQHPATAASYNVVGRTLEALGRYQRPEL